MPTGVYDPKWLVCRTPLGAVNGLAFTLSGRARATPGRCPTSGCSTSCAPPTAAMGSTLAYLIETARSLRKLRHPRS
jgi:cation transport protein ChaC